MAEAAGLKRRSEAAEPIAAKKPQTHKAASGGGTETAAAATPVPGSSAGQGGKAGGKAGGKGSGKAGKAAAVVFDKNYANLVQQVAKLSLTNSRDLALVKSVVVQTIIFQRNTKAGKVAEVVKNVTEDYFSTTRKMGQQERAKLGSPHVFAWLEALDFLLRTAKETGDTKLVELIQTHTGTTMEKAQANTPVSSTDEAEKQALYREEVQKVCKVFKIQKCWNPELARMEIVLAPQLMDTLYTALVDFLKVHAKAEVKLSQAPKTDTERKVGKALDKLRGDEMHVDEE
eukprot:TRINITY_DN21107_c0_g2_i1.p2 TRINITY_DN21107_c0_g2~~TRINITY_DN21107_c0_g2_i1.p2  ORF type:complete len:287 (-),score=103.11 TRINITY_DN21107_c0_g2_i1:257-1117(-)